MFWDNRGFARVDIKPAQEMKTPNLNTQDEVNLFKAITQEHVAMLKRVKKEEDARILADTQLRDEMHSFGMIECDIFDSDLKMLKLVMPDDAILDLPCRSTVITAFSVKEDRYRVTIPKGTIIYLYPIGRGTTSKKPFVGAYGLAYIGGALLAVSITYSEVFTNVLIVSLAEAFYTSGEILFPDSEETPAQTIIALSDMYGYK